MQPFCDENAWFCDLTPLVKQCYNTKRSHCTEQYGQQAHTWAADLSW